jgi:hypothetical protein
MPVNQTYLALFLMQRSTKEEALLYNVCIVRLAYRSRGNTRA